MNSLNTRNGRSGRYGDDNHQCELYGWKKFTHRVDLYMIPTMVENGWLPFFNYEDKRHGRTTPDYVPMHPVGFVKDNVHAWKCINRTTGVIFWRVADLIDGQYRNHISLSDLEEVISYEKIDNLSGVLKVVRYCAAQKLADKPLILDKILHVKLCNNDTVVELHYDHLVAADEDGDLCQISYEFLVEDDLKKINNILN